MSIKYIVIGLTALTTVGLLIKKKVNNWRELITQLQAFPSAFSKLDINFTRIQFVIDVTIFNPTKDSFNPDGIIAQLDRLEIDVKGKNIATVTIKKNGVQIPANGKFILKDLLVTVPTQNILYAKDIRSYNDINIKAIVNVLGEEYTI